MPTTDKDQAAQGKTVQVGIAMLSKPTPQWMKYILRGVALVSGIWALLPQDLLMVDDHDYGMINKWIIVINTVILFVIKFFGWSYPDNN